MAKFAEEATKQYGRGDRIRPKSVKDKKLRSNLRLLENKNKQAVLEAKLLEATLLLPAMLPEPLPLALQVLLVPQAERVVRRVVLLLVLPVLVRVTPQPL